MFKKIHASDTSKLRPIEDVMEPGPIQVDESTGLMVVVLFSLVGFVIMLSAAALGTTSDISYLRIPYSDVHDWYARVFQAERNRAWLSYLWDPQSEQRIPTARAVSAFDIEFSRGRIPTFLLASILLWLISIPSLIVMILKSPFSLITRAGMTLIVGILVFNIALAEDFAFPVFSVYLFATGPAIAALATVTVSADKGWRPLTFWFALGLAWLSSFGNSAGLAAWPALIAALILRSTERFTLWLAVTIMALCLGCLEIGLGVPSNSLGHGGSGVAHLIKMLDYFLIFGGLPWSRSFHPLLIQSAIGSTIWIIAGVFFVRGLSARHREAVVVTGMALIVFGFITAALASVGRVDELPQLVVPTRYTPFATALQIGVVLAGFGYANELRFRNPIGFAVGISTAAVVMLASVLHGIHAIEGAAERIRLASDHFDLTENQKELQISPRPNLAKAVRAELAQRGLPH